MELARLSQLNAHAKDGFEMRGEAFLAVFYPALHVGSTFVDVTVGYPVLSHLSNEAEISYGDFIASNELVVFQEVRLDDVQ